MNEILPLSFMFICIHVGVSGECVPCVCVYPMRPEEGGSPQAGITGVLQMELLSFARALHAFIPGAISPVTSIIPSSTFFQLRVTQMLIKKSSLFAILILTSSVPFYKKHTAPKYCFIEIIIVLLFF